MRVPLLVILVASVSLAGCALPEEEAPDHPLLAVCPQWIDGPAIEGTLLVGGAGTYDKIITPIDEDGNASLMSNGLPVDRYHLRFTNVSADGAIELRTFHNGTGARTGILDYRGGQTENRVFLSVGPGVVDEEFQTFLGDLRYDEPVEPGALRLTWQTDGAATVHYIVTPGYRVCGAIIE